MQLQPVEIKNYDTCVTYAAKRLGRRNLRLQTIDEFKKDFYLFPWKDSLSPDVGDVIAFTANERKEFVANKISAGMILESSLVTCGWHFCVVESYCDGVPVVSHLMKDKKTHTKHQH